MILLINNFLKELFKSKFKTFFLIFLIILFTLINTGFFITFKTLETSYDSYLKNQNVEDFSFESYSLNDNDLNNLSLKYNLLIEEELSKTYINNSIFTKVILYNSNNNINKPYLIKGKLPINDNEITILDSFAKSNNLNIGDIYKINNNSYKIVGFMYFSSYIYPMVSINNLIFNKSNNNIILVNFNTFNNFNSLSNQVYVAKLKDKSIKINSIFKEEQIFESLETISRDFRINSFLDKIQNDKFLVNLLTKVLLIIILLSITIFNIKNINNHKRQIGILKSLGYSNFKIIITYLISIFILIIIGSIIGYLLGFYLSKFLINKYLINYFFLIKKLKFSLSYYIKLTLKPLLIILSISFITLLFLLKNNILNMIKEPIYYKINKITKIINKLTKNFNFITRVKYLLLTSSFPKLIIIIITIAITSFLITFIFISKNLLNTFITDNYSNVKYDYVITYKNMMNDFNNIDDFILQKDTSLIKINDRKIDSTTITLNGITDDLKYLSITNKNNVNLLNYLADKTIIISSTLQEKYNLNKYDKLTFVLNNKEVVYEIIGISSYNEEVSFIKRSNLIKDLSLNSDCYNLKYSKDKKYSNYSLLTSLEKEYIYNLLSINDIKESLLNKVNSYNTTINIFILSFLIIVLFIILLTVSIILDDNRKNISLLKLLGYNNNLISKLIFNSYLPFIIITYFISVFITKKIIIKLVLLIEKNLNYILSVKLFIKDIVLGLVLLLIIYFVSLIKARSDLEKVPLSLVLKKD